jgi:VIT1/CCC1 family predicted Fe2+/Mn2+ transporter
MGLGGYLAARTDAEHYNSEVARERFEIDTLREREVKEVEDIFRGYGLDGSNLKAVIGAITSDRQRWIEFMMRFELGLERPNPSRAPISAATIAISYLVGGLIPLLPYILIDNVGEAFKISVMVTGISLLIFGGVKGYFTGVSRLKSAAQTLFVGGLAAAAAFGLAHLFG